MISYNNAYEIILNSLPVLEKEEVEIRNAAGRFLSEDIISDINIPPLDNSAMDGFAVIAIETNGASEKTPVKMRIIDEIQAGGDFEGKKLEPFSAIRIMTGAPVPIEADAVVPVEDTEENDGVLLIKKEVKKYENYRFAGEDVRDGSQVLLKGRKITSADVGLLASLNLSKIWVCKKPRVSIIATGNEIVEIGEDIKPGQIRNSNAHTLIAEITKYGGIPEYIGIARDNHNELENKIRKGMEGDIIITTGGVSMGKYDLVKEILEKIGVSIKIEKIKIKPGKPFIFGTLEEKIFFGFPGNPVSTMLSFIQFVRPALLKMMGSEKINKPVVSARLQNQISKKTERKEFMRGVYTIENGEICVETTGPQGSGILTSMSVANCLIVLPEESSGADKGDMVPIQLIYHEEI